MLLLIFGLANSAWLTRADCDDPALIYERKQEREQRHKRLSKGVRMTQDESAQVEALLLTWYLHERAYTPQLGAPRVSPSCRGHDSGDIHADGDDRDALLARLTAESVESCVDELTILHRMAIQTRMRNKLSGVAVFRNPRLGSPAQAHEIYQEAKAALWPKFRRKGLVR